MRVLMMPFSAKSHIYNMIPMAWALRTAGHQVRIVTQTNSGEKDTVASTGIAAVELGGDVNHAENRQRAQESGEEDVFNTEYQLAETRPEILTPDYVLRVFEMWSGAFRHLAGDEMLDELVGHATQWRPDLVIWDPLMYAGPLLARITGAAHARMLFGVDHIARMRQVFLKQRGTGAERGHDPVAEWMSTVLDRFGREFDEELVTGQMTIDPMPGCLRFPVKLDYLPVQYVPYNVPSTVPSWLGESPERPRVCVTLGVSNREIHADDESGVAALLEATADLDIEVIATLNAAQLESVRHLPDNVRAVDFVPLNDLMPSCSAVIHHGGTGAIGNAVLHGVPQLVIPAATWGEVAAAEALAGQGAGLFVAPENATADVVRGQLVRLLDEPSFAEGAARVRNEMLATATPNEIIPHLEELAASR